MGTSVSGSAYESICASHRPSRRSASSRPSMRNAPRICWLSLVSVASSARFGLSRKNASSTCSMCRRFVWISRPTCASSTRSCARFDISSSSGAAAAGAGRASRVEPRHHRLDLLRKILRQARVVLERALRQQDARRVFHRERLGTARRHLVEPLDERRRELHQRAVADLSAACFAPTPASASASAGSRRVRR